MVPWGWVQRGPRWHVGQAAVLDRHTGSQPVPQRACCPACHRVVWFGSSVAGH